ncbi:MAG: polysaccharide biosynthesis protein, partial [Flavobacteriales bacterium]|nr:polysaccharide biosynthesis protein [Flavobacteriales bacterium]
MLFIDLFLILFSLYFAFILRLGEPFPVEYLLPSWWVFVFTPIIMIPLFIKFGMYRSVLQYIGIKLIYTTFNATTISCLIIGF